MYNLDFFFFKMPFSEPWGSEKRRWKLGRFYCRSYFKWYFSNNAELWIWGNI